MSRSEVRTVRRGEPGAPDLSERIEGAMRCVRERAYEIFANRDAENGHDLDDWFKAEEEILMPFDYEVVADGDSMTVHLKIQGFEADELTVNIVEGRLLIEGAAKRAMQSEGAAETEQKTFLQQIAMPENADLDRVTADFRHDELRIKVPLMVAKKPVQSERASAGEAKSKSTAA